jgi:hypothetical protein
MKAPKILPWIARKAGLDDAAAFTLWQRASADSERQYGSRENIAYFSTVVNRFLELVEFEAAK